MDLTYIQIKEALKEIAERKGRPHFSVILVREVIASFREGKPHHLKQDVLNFYSLKFEKNSSLNSVSELSRLRSACKTDEDKRVLSERLGVTEKVISSLLKGRQNITPRLWARIAPILDDLPSVVRVKQTKRDNEDYFRSQPELWGSSE